MAALTAIMDELAAVLDDAVGTDVEQIVARRMFNPTPTSIDIYPADDFVQEPLTSFGQVAGGYAFVVRARVNIADNEAGQNVLLALMDPEDDLCVATALEDDETLNGLASTVEVTGPTGYRVYDDTGTQAFLGCEWRVVVIPVFT